MSEYIHGFTEKEQDRLYSQAQFLEQVVYPHVDLGQPKKILEIGCGVGAQTEILLRRYPNSQITGVDASNAQLARAKARFENAADKKRVEFKQGNAAALEFSNDSFDAAYICWLLEHVQMPANVVAEAYRTLKPGASLSAVEVQNSTLFFHPACPTFSAYWQALNDEQQSMGGDPYVGSKLGNLFHQAGFKDISVKPVPLFFDNTSKQMRLAFFEYWFELSMSAMPQLIEKDPSVQAKFDAIQKEFSLLKSAENAVFFYTFFVARGVK